MPESASTITAVCGVLMQGVALRRRTRPRVEAGEDASDCASPRPSIASVPLRHVAVDEAGSRTARWYEYATLMRCSGDERSPASTAAPSGSTHSSR